MRDLALAVIEGAVAAESLAKELRRTPDRSKHFQDIADRLRALVARATIRSALADDGTDSVSLARAVGMLPRNSVRITNNPPDAPPTGRASASGEVTISELPFEPQRGNPPKSWPQLDRIEAILQRLPGPGAMETLTDKLSRVEQLTSRALEGERQTVRSAEEVLALAGRIIDRLRREPVVTVRLEPGEG